MWNLEGMKVKATYLDEFPVEGTVELSRVAYGGSIKHTVVLKSQLEVYGSLRDRVIVDHSSISAVRD